MAEELKSYNIDALKGRDISDLEVRDALAEDTGINIPVDVCFTPKFPRTVIEETYKQNIIELQGVDNPLTGQKYSAGEAKQRAGRLKMDAMNMLKELGKELKLKL